MWTMDEEKIRKGATSRGAYSLLSAVSFLESAILPLPVDAVSIPMMIGAPSKAFRVANVALITSVLGGLLGYLIGYLFFEEFGEKIITYYGLAEQFAEFQQTAKDDWWKAATAIFIAAITPIPFKLVCIGSGVMNISLPLFIAVAMVGRAIRFYFFAIAFKYLGAHVRDFALRHLKLVGFLALLIMILGFASVYWI
mgnify:CR=1 FL=1